MFKYLAWSENIKKRVCRYLLQRYLGQFLQEKLTLDQLSVDLYNGTGNIYDVSLDCEGDLCEEYKSHNSMSVFPNKLKHMRCPHGHSLFIVESGSRSLNFGPALDELGESQGWPFEFVDGYIRQISVVIPWSTLLRDESCVEVHGLCVTIQPKMRFETATSMLESMWSSMSSSMQMAAECLQQEPGVTNAKPVEGIEHFAATIDSILSRVKIRFINTKIRMEHMPKDSSSGVAFEVHVKNIEYCDEAGTEPTDLIENEKNKTFVVTTFSNKRISFEGISLHTDEFSSNSRTMARSLIDDGTLVKAKSKDDKCDETEHVNKMSSSSSSSSPKESTPEEDNYMSATDSINLNEEQQPFPKVSPVQESVPNTTPIFFAKITGKSELYIKLKQSEDATGPKVELQLMLGSLITFLSPRQLHTIIELCDGLASPHLEDTSNVPVKNSSMPCKPMKATDFERVEAQLLGGLVGGSMPSLLAKHGWSGAVNMDDSEMESECFLPLTNPHSQPAMSDSCASSVSSLSTSTSTSYSSKHRVKRNKKIPQIDGDPTAEVSHINIRVASFACILLHNDILIPMLMGNECLMASSVKQMQETAESFFEKLGAFAISGYGNKDFEYAEKVFEKAITLSHLRLITASVTVEGNEKTTSQGCLVSAHLTVARAQLQESLYSNTNTKPSVDTFTLLHFQREEKDDEYENNPLDALPDIKIHFTQTQKAMRIAGEKRLVYPTAEFNVNLQPCTVDLDITLLDRIWAVLHPLPLCQPRAGCTAGHTDQLLDHSLAAAAQFETHTSFKVTCSKLLLKLRFPVIDLRPQHDMSRTPWWQRNVRADYLLATLQQLTVSDSPRARYGKPIKIQAHQIDLHYFENDTCCGFHLGRAHTDTLVDTSNIMFGIEAKYPTINLTFLGSTFGSRALEHSSEEELGGVGGLGASMAHSGLFMDGLGAGNAKPSPFSHKKTMHQSDTPHAKDTRDNVEELIVPGSPEEMAEFEQHSINRAAIQIECQVPVLSVQLDSKHLYEVIYNRINSDLLLWEPTPQNPYPGSQAYPTQLIDPNIYPVFSMCKNGLNYDSDTASSSSDESNVYYSTYEQKCRDYSKAKSVTATGSESGDRRHNLCLSLKVGKGLLTMYTLVRDTQKNVVPGHHGEAVLNVSGLSLCHVSGVCSNSRSALLALYAHTARLYHAGLIPAMSVRAPLRLYGCGLPSHLIDTIYPSSKGVRLDATGVKEMLTIALSVQPNPDLPNYKNIKVSIGIRGATLGHRTELAGRSWLMQLMDQLDVLDYPVPGYRPSTVLTQLHVHLWDCAVDYRPLNLPLRAMVTLGSFSISSNVIAEANTSNLRFIAEECGLFLADMTTKEKATQAQNINTAFNLQKDYVCVVDLGLFELSLRLTEKSASVLSPRVDLRASNDAVHVRTCADSARALCRLLAYVAADGDAIGVTAPPQREHTPTPAHDLLGDGMEDKVTEEIRDLSPSEVQQVNDLMEEAMKESPNSSLLDSDPNNPGGNPGVEVFFFPDEPHPKSSVVSQEDKNSSECISGPSGNQHLLADEELQQEFVGEVESVEPETVQLLPAIIHVERDLGNVHASIMDRKNYKNIEKNEGTLSDGEAANTDDEFCMLGDEMTSRAKAKVNEYAEPVVRWLTSEPMAVLDNHFALPQGKGDVLKAPKNFPVPVTRYTLCEMTLVWHMYGGNDFNTNTDSQAKKSVTINDRVVHSPTPTRRSSESDPYNVIPRSPNCRYSAQSYLAGGVSYKKGHEGVRPGATQASGSPCRTPSAPWKHRGGAGRLQTILVEMELNKMKFRHESYPGGGRYASRQTLAVGAMQVRDRHNDSHFNMFLNLYTPDDKPRGRNTNMVCVKAVHLRPDPRLPAQECCLKVSLQPLRFIIDQDTLLFLSDFFSKLGEDSPTSERTMSTCSEHSQSSGSGGSVGSASRHSTPTHQLPVMSVGAALKDGERRKRQASISSESSAMVNSDTYSEDMASLNGGSSSNYDPLLEQYEAEQMLSDNLIQLEEGCRRAASVDVDPMQDDITETSSVAGSDVADDAPIYFRRVIFSPEVPIRLDYYGKRVNLSQGSLAGIVVGLVLGLGQLNCSELRLKRLSHRHGLLGFNRLLHWLLQKWLHDIKRNQLAGILGGVGPMRSLLQLFQGVYDLFRLPWEQWRRDGRVVRGLRRGAASFSARTAIAALDITTRLVHLIQATAETAFDMLTPSPSLGLPGSYPRHRRARRRHRDSARPPQDIREGVANAYQLVKEGFSDTAATMVCVAAAERDARGYSGAVGGVLRQLPGAAVAPVALAAAAAADILGGVRAQLVPGARDHARDKWRRQPSERDARVDLDSDVEEAEE